MDFEDINKSEQNIILLPQQTTTQKYELFENTAATTTINGLNENDLQFLMSHNFLVLDFDNNVFEKIDRKLPEITPPIQQSFETNDISIPLEKPVNNSETPAQLIGINQKLNLLNDNKENKTNNSRNSRKRKSKTPRKFIENESKKNLTKCDICNEIFNDLKSLKSHKNNAHIFKKQFKCDQCSEEFNFGVNHTVHIALHQSDLLKICPICNYKFQRQASFLGHLKTHFINDNFKCDDCQEEFDYKEYFDKHLENYHNKILKDDEILEKIIKPKKRPLSPNSKRGRKYACNKCEMRFTKPTFLRRHQISHANIKPYECFECNQRFTQKSSLDRHKSVHTGDKRFTCPKCSFRFSQKSNLVFHIKRVHFNSLSNVKDINIKIPEKIYSCKDCSCVFSKINSLSRHRTQMHSTIIENYSDQKELTTDDVDVDEITIKNVMNELKSWQQFMEDQESLSIPESPNQQDTKHIIQNSPIQTTEEIQNNINEILSKQEITEYQNDLKGSHEIHEAVEDVKIVEEKKVELTYEFLKHEIIEGIKYYICLYCGKKSTRSNTIIRHFRTHTKIKNFKCEICGKPFGLKFNLKSHMKIHQSKIFSTPRKLYHCYICSERFSSLKRLDFHNKSVHNNQNIFKCTICDNSFKTFSYLRVHTLKHLNNENIDKSLLEPIFIGSPTLEKKLKITTDDENTSSLRKYQCLYCGFTVKNMYDLIKHEETHSSTKSLKCIVCEKKFSSSVTLYAHRKLHIDSKKFNCYLCNENFTRKANLNRHLNVKHSVKEKCFKCRYCEKTYHLEDQCRRHMKTHLKAPNKNVKSVSNEQTESERETIEIEKKLEIQISLTSNGQQNHANEINYNMEIDSNNQQNHNFFINNISNKQTISNIENIQLYNPTVSQENSTIIPYNINETLSLSNTVQSDGTCSILPASNEPYVLTETITPSKKPLTLFSKFLKLDNALYENIQLPENIIVDELERNTNSFTVGENTPEIPLLKNNQNIVETNDKQAKPIKNKKSSKQLSSISTVPQNEKTNNTSTTRKSRCNCSFCGKGFKKPSDLIRHMRTHTNDKPFECDICSRAFTLKKTLENHKNTHDNNRQYFNCNVCGKKYASNDILKVHLRIHTGEKPYNCEFCSNTFRTVGHRNAHVKAHHKIKKNKKKI